MIPLDRCCEVWYSELAVYWGVGGMWGGVMRKTTTTLTYRGDKMTKRYQVLKKIFWGKKNPVRLLYVKGFGTTISPWDEVRYIVSCLCETLNIMWSHYMKKFPRGKNGL